MSIKTIHLAASIENDDYFHLARLLVLLREFAGKNNRPVEGIMKLAKLDFLLRYPNCLARVLKNQNKEKLLNSIPLSDQNTIEAHMIRFRYGPWDSRYRKWIAILSGKDLVGTYIKGRTVFIALTESGQAIAEQLEMLSEYKQLIERSRMIKSCVGSYSATKLKEYIYEVFPEITNMKWGKDIEL